MNKNMPNTDDPALPGPTLPGPTLPDYAIRDLDQQVDFALREDIGSSDLTAALIPEAQTGKATIITREPAVICGRPWVDSVFRRLDPEMRLSWYVADGEEAKADQVLCTIEGRTRAILTGERTALNFLQTLSGTATASARFAKAAAANGITVLDTRKTLPGLRTAQKYAVLCGGCENHRIGLYDAFLIKENHIMACGSISAAIAQARQQAPDKRIIVEVENLEEFHEALNSKPDQIMLDNFSIEDIATAAAQAGPVQIEVSGNQELDSLGTLGVQGICVSSGAITKHVRAVDLSLRLVPQ